MSNRPLHGAQQRLRKEVEGPDFPCFPLLYRAGLRRRDEIRGSSTRERNWDTRSGRTRNLLHASGKAAPRGRFLQDSRDRAIPTTRMRPQFEPIDPDRKDDPAITFQKREWLHREYLKSITPFAFHPSMTEQLSSCPASVQIT